jgi:hypothetical protein
VSNQHPQITVALPSIHVTVLKDKLVNNKKWAPFKNEDRILKVLNMRAGGMLIRES